VAGRGSSSRAPGYTGEDGFEIYLPNDLAPVAGAAMSGRVRMFHRPRARDTLRLEMKYAPIDATTLMTQPPDQAA